MRPDTLLVTLLALTLWASGCETADCPDGFTSNADGLCLEHRGVGEGESDADTDTDSDTDPDTDSDTDPDTDSDTDTDTDTDTDSDTDTDTHLDADADGYAAGDGDCDDADAAVNPGASEICDGIDQDCDGTVDQPGLVTFTSASGDVSDLGGDFAAGVETAPAAIGLSEDGDLAVCAGVYWVTITSEAEDLYLWGPAGSGETTLSGGGVATVLFITASGSVTVIDGLTLSDAGGDDGWYGIVVTGTQYGTSLAFAYDVAVTLTDSVVTGSQGTMAAMLVSHGTLALEDSSIQGNDAWYGLELAFADGSCTAAPDAAAGVYGNSSYGVEVMGFATKGYPASFSSTTCDFGTSAEANGSDVEILDTSLGVHVIYPAEWAGDDATFVCDAGATGTCE